MKCISAFVEKKRSFFWKSCQPSLVSLSFELQLFFGDGDIVHVVIQNPGGKFYNSLWS